MHTLLDTHTRARAHRHRHRHRHTHTDTHTHRHTHTHKPLCPLQRMEWSNGCQLSVSVELSEATTYQWDHQNSEERERRPLHLTAPDWPIDCAADLGRYRRSGGEQSLTVRWINNNNNNNKTLTALRQALDVWQWTQHGKDRTQWRYLLPDACE